MTMLAGLDQPAGPPEPPSAAQVMIGLTQAAIGAAEGQQPVEAVQQAIAQAGPEPGLSAAGRDYLTALGRSSAIPPTVCEALGQAGAAVLPYLSGPEAAGLGLALARLLDRHGQPALAWPPKRKPSPICGRITVRPGSSASASPSTTRPVIWPNWIAWPKPWPRWRRWSPSMNGWGWTIWRRIGPRWRLCGGSWPANRRPPPPLMMTGAALATLQAALAQAPPEAQAQLRQMIEQVSALSPAEQAAYARELQRREIEAQAGAIVEAAIEARQAGQVADLLPHLAEAAAHYADGAAPGSPYADLAQFVRAVAALLQGQAPEPVAPAYVERLAEAKRRLAE
ncbi:MAG: hypothetical protein H6632_17545 [Anaerolineales bacterium]|nr:hypothetical protein [Anaerolineales bacterium]